MSIEIVNKEIQREVEAYDIEKKKMVDESGKLFSELLKNASDEIVLYTYIVVLSQAGEPEAKRLESKIKAAADNTLIAAFDFGKSAEAEAANDIVREMTNRANSVISCELLRRGIRT